MKFVILYTPGPTWIQGQSFDGQPLDAHVEYMRRLIGEGTVLMGGPLQGTELGLAVVEAQDEKQVKDILKNDPPYWEASLRANYTAG